jgi:proline utilization trans-activator
MLRLIRQRKLLIISTRPILLHVVRTRLTQSQFGLQVPDAAQALADTCVRCARHSCSLLIESWTNGSFMIFDYLDTQYMFSSATVLALSVIRDKSTSTSDRDQLECIGHFLSQLKDSGNYAAAEFHQHISAITSLVDAAETQFGFRQAPAAENNAAAGVAAEPSAETYDNLQDFSNGSSALEISLEDPLFRDLLAQPATDLQFIDEASFTGAGLGLPWFNVEI